MLKVVNIGVHSVVFSCVHFAIRTVHVQISDTHYSESFCTNILMLYMLCIFCIVNSFNWKRGCYGSSCIVCSVLVCKIHVCFIAVKEFHVQKVSDRNVKKTLSKYLCFWNTDRLCTRTSIRNGVLCSVCKMISRLSNTPSDIEMDMNICVESLKRSSLLRVIRMLYE